MTGQITVRPIDLVGQHQVFASISQKKRKSLMWYFMHSAKKMNHKYLIRGFNNNLSNQHV